MFEAQVEDCLLRGDSPRLVSLLHYEGLTGSTLIRLDQLVTKELCRSGFSRVLVVLKSLGILSENKDDLQTLVSHGLTAKVLLWFEAVCDLLMSDLQRSSAPLLNLAEGFFDYFLLLGQASLPVSQLSVVLLQLLQLTLQTEIHFPLRLEAIRTFNSVLEALSREQRRLIQNDHNHSQILPQVAAAVLTVGDYELQVSLSEALCRMTPRRARQHKANQWFSSRDISDAFCDIRDADFELWKKTFKASYRKSATCPPVQDCRRFLNFLNCYHGDQRRVFTFPCLRAFLSSTQLFRPKDEKLDEFWIDFNVGSGCVSFFIDEPQGFLWGSIHVLKEEVDHYTLQVKQDETVLSVWLNNPIMHHNVRGQTVELTFNCKHHEELEEAAGRVFMKVQNTPDDRDPGGAVRASTSENKHSGRTYGRKKQSNSQLKILPLSSPSSEEDSPVSKPAARSTAEVLFDEIRHSTSRAHSFPPSSDITVDTHLPDTNEPVSGDPEGLELQVSQEFEESSSPLEQDMFRKRKASDSGYLSDQTEAVVHKRRVEEGGGSEPAVSDCSPEEAGQSAEGAGPPVVTETPVSELGIGPESGLTCDITAAFKTFRAQLDEHFTGHWQKVEGEILHSLKECQQHVSALLTAVHQHRLLLLQKLESSISDQVKRLEEDSSNLNSLSTQIQSFFQCEMQRLSSFCDKQLQRLKSLEGGEAAMERASTE